MDRRALTACTLVVALAAARNGAGQDPVAVTALTRETAVRGALDTAKATENRTIADQIRFCEVPAPPFMEAARGDVLRKAFVEVGLLNVRTDKAGNVLGDRPGDRPAPRLVVAAHLDTVFPEGTAVAVKRQGNILRGPGIGDNCRGLAVLVAIARSMNQARISTPGPITFVANVGEEGLGDLRGVKALFNDTLKGQIDRFVSIDNAGTHISTVGVGSYRYRVTFSGPGGHSFGQFGVPNPANALGRAVAKIADLQVPRDPLTTFNVGRIGGGTSVNAIPTEAWMEIDLRSSDPAALTALDRRVATAIDQAASEENTRWGRAGVITVKKELVGDRPAGSIADDAPIVRTAQAAARAVGLIAPLSESSSDANLALSLKIPAITIGGGGRSVNSHVADEYFDASESWKGTQNAVLLTIALAR